MERVDENVVGQGQNHLFFLGVVVEDVVVHVQILLSEGHCQLVFDKAGVQIFFDDPESVFAVGEVEEGGGEGVEGEAEAAGLPDVLAVH